LPIDISDERRPGLLDGVAAIQRQLADGKPLLAASLTAMSSWAPADSRRKTTSPSTTPVALLRRLPPFGDFLVSHS